MYDVIVDGLMFGLTGGGDAVPIVTKDIRTVPSADSLPRLEDNIQFSMAFAEAVMSDQSSCTNTGLQEFVRRYLRWLARCIPASVQDESLLRLRVRALDLAKYAADPGYGRWCSLPSADSGPLIKSILSSLHRIRLQDDVQNEQKMADRRLEERMIDVGETLNQNIIASGGLLSDVIEANAAQQKDLEGYYDGVVAQQNAEAQKQLASINSLEASLFEAQGAMDFAQQKYKAAVHQKKITDSIQLGLDIAAQLFKLAQTSSFPGRKSAPSRIWGQ